MSKFINPTSMEELKEIIPVVPNGKVVRTGYIVELNGSGEVEFRRYENGEELEDETIYVGMLMYDDFDEFMKEVKDYVGRKKVYLSHDIATIVLAVINDKLPEDYDD